MQKPTSKQMLDRAYGLIRKGEKAQALAIVKHVCQSEPQNVDAWWLLANAVDDPAYQIPALERVLLLDPFHEAAEKRLARLQSADELPSLEFPQIPTSAPPRQQGSILPVLLIAGLLLLIVGGAAVFILLGASDEESPVASEGIATRTVVTNAPTQAQAASNPTVTRPPRQTSLPATWTPQPTYAGPTRPPQISDSGTPWYFDESDINARATADPSLFGETYWLGNGDGVTMDQYARSGGRYLRFYDFPVKVFLDAPNDPIWRESILNVIGQLEPYVPMELVDFEPDATMSVIVLDPTNYERWSGCPAKHTAGCASVFDLGDIGGGDNFHRIYGQVWIASDTPNIVGTLLHEMLHALGVYVHSPYPDDIMYFQITRQTTLSKRDINTLRRLYANPSYAD